jgi:hypothetical protein
MNATEYSYAAMLILLVLLVVASPAIGMNTFLLFAIAWMLMLGWVASAEPEPRRRRRIPL